MLAANALDSRASDRGAPGALASCDCLTLVGGGLQNALIALALLHEQPEARVCLIERENHFGGNHTWCFHEGDATTSALPWLSPLVVKRWAAYDVAFPGLKRRVQQRYSAISSERLERVLREKLLGAPNAHIVQQEVTQVEPGRVHLASGDTRQAGFIIDSRGPRLDAKGERHVQKFVGLELEVSPHTVPQVPMLMDACVPQRDGFRFFYVLPLADNRVLVEDTYYSDDARLDREGLKAGILDYANGRGLQVQAVLREEHGVLPLPIRQSESVHVRGVLEAGYRGGFFHPTTGYSLPCALRVAAHVARSSSAGIAGPELEALIARHRSQARYCLWLNRMLFGAFAPEGRFTVLERFYRLPEDTIRNFYALDMSAVDRARIVCGRPPAGFSAWRLYQSLGQPT